MQDKYIFWENTNTDPSLNLAIEESLLDSDFTKENAVFMLWQNAPAVIIGRHQNAYEEVDMPFLEQNSIKLVRRHSGGGAVYHDLGNVNFTFIIPSNKPKIDFATVLKPMLLALETIGIKANLSGRNDILADNKKISGAAQTKGKHAVLVHGTLLIDVHLDNLEHVLAGNPDKYESKGISSIRSRVANIKEFINKDMPQNEAVILVKQALINYFTESKEAIIPEEIIHNILEKAKINASKRYANDTWNLMKSPPFSVSNRKKFPFGAMRVSYNIKDGQIIECKIEGDFFAIADINLIEKALQNCLYKDEEIDKVLKNIDFSKNILNAPSQENSEYLEVKALFLVG